MSKYGLAAEFFNPVTEEDTYTFYDEVKFDSYEEALVAVNEEYGETLVAAAQIDIENEANLQGFVFEDLVPYELDLS